MSLLRPSIAGRLLRAGPQASKRFSPGAVRWESQAATTGAASKQPTSNKVVDPAAVDNSITVVDQSFEEYKPHYQAVVDHASSQFSPVPRRLLDGSEAADTLAGAVLSGAPVELEARTVRISRPAKPATQSGNWNTKDWRMDWDILPKGHRWENPLMGWQSSADFMQGTHLNFNSKEEAVAFAEKQGYEYFVQEPNTRKFAVKAYANNFLWSSKKLKHIRTK